MCPGSPAVWEWAFWVTATVSVPAVPSPSRRRPSIFFPGLIPPTFCSSQAGAAFVGGGGCPGSTEAVGSCGPSRGVGWRSLLRRCSTMILGPAKHTLECCLARAAVKERFVWVSTSEENDLKGFLFHCQLPMDLGLPMENPRARWLESCCLSPCSVGCQWDEAAAAQFRSD